jgi:hypothetical protein
MEVLTDDLLEKVETHIDVGVLIGIVVTAEIDDGDDAHEPKEVDLMAIVLDELEQRLQQDLSHLVVFYNNHLLERG